jgi:hypothetical protein
VIAWDARKGLFAILGEHRHHDVCHDIEFRLVRRRQVNENVSGVDSYLAVLRVYDGREGKHTIFPVINDRVDRGVANNGQVFCQMTIRLSYASMRILCRSHIAYFIDRHQFFCSVRSCLVQGDEFYVLGRLGLVAEWRRDGIQIVRADGNELSFPTDVLV